MRNTWAGMDPNLELWNMVSVLLVTESKFYFQRSIGKIEDGAFSKKN